MHKFLGLLIMIISLTVFALGFSSLSFASEEFAFLNQDVIPHDVDTNLNSGLFKQDVGKSGRSYVGGDMNGELGNSYVHSDRKIPNEGLVTCSGIDDCSFAALLETLSNVLTFLLQLATSLATLIFAYAGFLYLTAAGDTGKITQAHGLISNAVIGFLIAISAWLIIEVILNTLGVTGAFNPL